MKVVMRIIGREKKQVLEENKHALEENEELRKIVE